jgi:pectate lyase
MKKSCFILTAAILLSGLLTFAQETPLPAFPGAEGFGAFTPGGRGGKVYVVTSLADSGAGTFREACSAKGPRTVVFNVSGIIELKTPLVISNPYITIAGQTAPGDGICLKRRELKISTHDVIVRYIRSRPGDIEGAEMDAISVVNGGHDVILDHCSANWSIDEGLSPSGDIYNITVQWCLIGQALLHSVHKKGAHGFGSLVRGTGGITLHHNLWIDNVARNPRLGDNYNKPPWPTIDVRNNVMYNWGDMASGMTGGNISVNYVGNYLKPGPSSSNRRPIVLTKTSKVQFYLKDNIVEGRPHHTASPDSMFEDGGDRALYQIVEQAFKVPPVKMSSAEQALKDVLATVGASRPVRDSVDARLIREVETNTGKMIDSQNDVGGWPVYRSVKPYKDTDKDGIPDSWEIENKMNHKNPADAMEKVSEGYTRLEIYMNGRRLLPMLKN